MLVPKLLSSGYEVNVLDLMIYGNGLAQYAPGKNGSLKIVRGDLRNKADVRRALKGCQAVIHLACISNDPCFELDPEWCRSIDLDTMFPLIQEAKHAGVRRFIYASSSSVYGVRGEEEVTEELPLAPVTEYSKCKALCEDILRAEAAPGFATTILRPATVCGYSPRLRLDVVVNALTARALAEGRIIVEGGGQYRANLHILDMIEIYVRLLELPDEAVAGKTWNVGASNLRVIDIADRVRRIIGNGDVRVDINEMVDARSYRVSSERIKGDIGFVPQRRVTDAVHDLATAFEAGQIPDAMTSEKYYNVKTLKKYIAKCKSR
jgi:nucleoside-diphosphate-sugar epimerase